MNTLRNIEKQVHIEISSTPMTMEDKQNWFNYQSELELLNSRYRKILKQN